jgi:hypothetical protein
MYMSPYVGKRTLQLDKLRTLGWGDSLAYGVHLEESQGSPGEGGRNIPVHHRRGNERARSWNEAKKRQLRRNAGGLWQLGRTQPSSTLPADFGPHNCRRMTVSICE